MKKHLFIATLGIFTILLSCENNNKRKTEFKKSLDYSNQSVLDSVMKATPHSKEKMFLGFTIGMTKNDYKNHITDLKKEGKTFSHSNSNRISNVAGTFDLGSGYTFKTNITSDVGDKKLTGDGQYFLEPVYNQEEKLMKLNIVPIEKWNGDYGYDKPKWLEKNVIENSKPLDNDDIEKALQEGVYGLDSDAALKNRCVLEEERGKKAHFQKTANLLSEIEAIDKEAAKSSPSAE
jgi:hypothetical protein